MSILVIGFVLLILRFLQLGWKVIKDEAEGFHFADEAEESMEIAKELQETALGSDGIDDDPNKSKQTKQEDK